jgi:pimeloyl-ACP methyl ester carboxylesterase
VSVAEVKACPGCGALVPDIDGPVHTYVPSSPGCWKARLEHAIELCRNLPDSELAIIPGTSHGLLVEKPTLCNTLIIDFLKTDPVPTMPPIRRA